MTLELPGYDQYWNYAEKKGYSGTAIFTKEEPSAVSYGIGIEEHDHEGTSDHRWNIREFYMVTVLYTQTPRTVWHRLDYRMEWESAFSWLSEEAGGEKAGDFLRRSECGASRRSI